MFLCGGDALIDFVPVAAPEGGVAFAPRPGGAVLNAATALARLGAPVSFVGALSEDLFGDLLHDHMVAEGIDTAHVARTADDSTLAFVSLAGGEAKYAFYDATSAGRRWSGAPEAPMTAQALHIGSVTLIAEPSAEAYAALAETMSPHMVVSLDPNCRPGLIDDAQRYRARIARIAAVSHVVRVSDEDFAYLYGARTEDSVAEQLFKGATRLLLVSRGADGATAYWPGGRLDVAARTVALADTIGAGDTFHAGVLAALSRSGRLTASRLADLDQATVAETLAFATCAAALNCEASGCNPPDLNAVLDALKRQSVSSSV